MNVATILDGNNGYLYLLKDKILRVQRVNVKAVLLFVPLICLTLSPPNKLSSVKFLNCFNFQSASMRLKFCENVVRVSNSLDPGETPSYSAAHPDPSCLHMELQLCLRG